MADEGALKDAVIEHTLQGSSMVEAAGYAGADLRSVIRWRRTDPTFAKQYAEAVEDAAARDINPAGLVREAHAFANAGDRHMLRMLLEAYLPYQFCPKARTLRIIDEQARAAAEKASETGSSESAALILAHLDKLAATKAGLVGAGQ